MKEKRPVKVGLKTISIFSHLIGKNMTALKAQHTVTKENAYKCPKIRLLSKHWESKCSYLAILFLLLLIFKL